MRILKEIACWLFIITGLTWVAARINRRKVVVLAFHGIHAGELDPVLNFDGMHVRVERFVRQMRYLAARYDVVPLDALLERPAGSRHGKTRAAITFDDGYKNTYRHAYPVLRQFGLPATVFIALDFLLHGRAFWWDRVRGVVAAAPRPSVHVRIHDTVRQFRLVTLRQRQDALRYLSPQIRRLRPESREAVLATLAREVGMNQHATAKCEPLSITELREMAQGGISVGSHGCSHDSFLHLSRDTLQDELLKSRRVLESVTGHPVAWLCYPYGEFSGEAIGAAIKAGYRGAVTTIEGLTDGMRDPYTIRRIGVNDTMTFAQFLVATSGLRDMLKGLLRLRWLREWLGAVGPSGGPGWEGRLPAAAANGDDPTGGPVHRQPVRPTIALVAPTMDILGGHAVQLREIVRGLRGEGYEALFVPINPAFPTGLRWLRRIPYARTVLNETLYVSSLVRLRRADVVHVFSAAYWGFVLAPVPAMIAARIFGKRVILHYHSGQAPHHLARWGPLVHPWLRLADEIVVPSEFLRAVFARYGYPARVIPNIVDTTRFTYRERPILRPRLLSTRNLEPHYRVDMTLLAFARVRARYPDATLIVAGYGSEEGRLRRLAASLGEDGIRFVGRVEPGAMPRLCDEADVFLNSSVIDNQPVSVLEAFAAGLPVVSTATGDLAALVRDDETGLIVPPEDPGAMADAVARLLDDHDLAVAIVRRARQEVERYTWPNVRHAWAAAYSSNGSTRSEQGPVPV